MKSLTETRGWLKQKMTGKCSDLDKLYRYHQHGFKNHRKSVVIRCRKDWMTANHIRKFLLWFLWSLRRDILLRSFLILYFSRLEKYSLTDSTHRYLHKSFFIFGSIICDTNDRRNVKRSWKTSWLYTRRETETHQDQSILKLSKYSKSLYHDDDGKEEIGNFQKEIIFDNVRKSSRRMKFFVIKKETIHVREQFRSQW